MKSYNFTSGIWKNLADTPFKKKALACMRVMLSNGKNVVLAIGQFQNHNLQNKIDYFIILLAISLKKIVNLQL